MPFEQYQRDNPEPSYYTFEVWKVEDGPLGPFGPSMKWYLQIVTGSKGGKKTYLEDSSGTPFEIQMLTSNKVSPKSRAGKLVSAIFGCPVDLVELATLEDTLPGGTFKAMLTINENGYPSISHDVAAADPKPLQPSFSS